MFYKDKTFPPNHFEWFFEQPALSRHFRVVLGRHPSVPLNSALPKDLVHNIQASVKQQWKMRPEFTPRLRESTLAVHYRGTDKYTEVPPTPLPRLFYLIDQTIQTHQLKNILFCTDDSDVLEAVIKQYPHCEYYHDHLRTSGTRGLHHKLGSYRQAREAFTELLAMGACTRLLCSRGCMSDTALMLAHNRQIEWDYHN